MAEHAIKIDKPICERCGRTLDVKRDASGHYWCGPCDWMHPQKTINQYWHKLNKQYERQTNGK
jgi:ribosomal protein L37AE/L43A